MPGKLTGAFYTYRTHALYVGPLIATARHGHHAGQVIWAPGGVDVEGEHGPARRAVVHCLKPHEAHSHGPAAAAAVLWVDREGLRWDRESRDASIALSPDLCCDPVRPEVALEVADALLALVTPMHEACARPPCHPAVKRMCSLLDADTDTDTGTGEGKIRIGQLARQSGLSARQLRHRFTEELGINPSAYLRWHRLRRAIAGVEAGATLTEGALDGGFADGAHFARVFQAHFGMAPSQAFASARFVSSVVESSGGFQR